METIGSNLINQVLGNFMQSMLITKILTTFMEVCKTMGFGWQKTALKKVLDGTQRDTIIGQRLWEEMECKFKLTKETRT